MKDIDYGTIQINLQEIMNASSISINKLSCRSEMQRTQLKSYMRNDVQRLDISVLARLCYVLEVEISDLIQYVPPKENKN